jgi:hypothetical protein
MRIYALFFLVACNSSNGSGNGNGTDETTLPLGSAEFIVTDLYNQAWQNCGDNFVTLRTARNGDSACVEAADVVERLDLRVGDRVSLDRSMTKDGGGCLLDAAITGVIARPDKVEFQCTFAIDYPFDYFSPSPLGVGIGSEGLPSDGSGFTTSLWLYEVPIEVLDSPDYTADGYVYTMSLPTNLVDMSICGHKLCNGTDVFIDIWDNECSAGFTYAASCTPID